MKKYMMLLFMILSLSAFGQGSVKHLKPKMGEALIFDPKDEELIKRRDDLYKLDKLTAAQEKELKALESKFPEQEGSIWDALSMECSWYCGGGPRTITASSYLNSSGKINYLPENIHDLIYKTVWSEGVVGYCIG